MNNVHETYLISKLKYCHTFEYVILLFTLYYLHFQNIRNDFLPTPQMIDYTLIKLLD